jgi:Undecaprenyl-phosphate glucose phosphotransferase
MSASALSHLPGGKPIRKAISLPVIEAGLCVLDVAILALLSYLTFSAYAIRYLHYDQASAVEDHAILTVFTVAIGTYLLNPKRFTQVEQITRGLAGLRLACTRWTIVVLISIAVAFITKTSGTFSRGWLLIWYCSSIGYLCVSRYCLVKLTAYWIRRGYLRHRIVIFGSGEPAVRLLTNIRRQLSDAVEIVGFFDDRATRRPGSLEGVRYLGSSGDLLNFVRAEQIDEIIIALPLQSEQRVRELVAKLRILPVDISIALANFPRYVRNFQIEEFGREHVRLRVAERPLKDWAALIKRVEDIALSLCILVFFLPMMALIAILIRLNSRGPILFVQPRFGFNNKTIRVFKFRTMYHELSDITGAERTSPGDTRVTRVGRFLRKTSLDELPQLFNVLNGTMSLVGPRPHPLAMKAVDKAYADAVADYFARHRVKPGLTGWAQVHGCRGEIDTHDKAQRRVEHDLHYIENWSIALDAYIMMRTVIVILSRQQAY